MQLPLALRITYESNHFALLLGVAHDPLLEQTMNWDRLECLLKSQVSSERSKGYQWIDALTRTEYQAMPSAVREVAFSSLREGLCSSNAHHRAWAAGALWQTNEDWAISALHERLDDPEPGVRTTAEHALISLRDPRFIRVLEERLDSDDPKVRENAISGLKILCPPSAVAPLARLLVSKGCREIWEVAETLAKIGGLDALRALLEGFLRGGVGIESNFRHFPVETAGRVFLEFLLKAETSELAHRLGRYAKCIEPTVARQMIATASGGEQGQRRNAAIAVGYCVDIDGIGIPQNLLEDDAIQVREAVVWAQARLRAKAVKSESGNSVSFRQYLLHDPDDGVRVAAAKRLHDMGDADAIDSLLVGLHDESEIVRVASANGLMNIATPDAFPDLISGLRDPARAVRHACACALASVADVSCATALARALLRLQGAEDRECRIMLIEALRRTGDPWAARIADKAAQPDVAHSLTVDGRIAGGTESYPMSLRETPEVFPVQLGISAKQRVTPGTEFTVTLAAYSPTFENSIREQLLGLSPHATIHNDLQRCRWSPGAEVTVILTAEELIVEERVRTFQWNGERELVFFDVRVPVGCAERAFVLKLDLFIKSICVARMRLDVEVANRGSNEQRAAFGHACETAFASHCSRDRARVLDMVSAIELSSGLDVFVDCLDLRAGEQWWPALQKEIFDRDLFLLFWSAHSRVSPWVEKEWRFALVRKQPESIRILPLELPQIAPPPAELSHLHFGDVRQLARIALSAG